MDNLLLTKELDRFYYLWRESIAIYEDWAKQYGLSNNVVMVMESIYNNRENCTPSSISHKWFIPKDKRNKVIQLTKKGEEIIGKIVLKLRKLEFYTLNQMGKEKIDNMNDGLEEFIRLFREGGKNE